MKYKIGHVITRYNRGGTTTWISDLSRGLIDRGHKITIYCGPTKLPEVENDTLLEFKSRKINTLLKSANPLTVLRSVCTLRSLIKTDSLDVLISHTSHAGIIAKLSIATITKASRPRLIHTYHGQFLNGYFNGLQLALYKFIEKSTRNMADGYFVSGKRVYDSFLESRILSLENSVCLVNPPIKFFSEEIHTPKLQESSLTIGWLARIAPIKRFDRVIYLANQFPNDLFLVGGDFEMSTAAYSVLPKNIKLLGWVSTQDFWPMCDLALCTSDNEAQPISLLEAATHAIPALTTNVGSCADAVLHMETGFVVDATLEALKSGLLMLREDRELIRTLGLQAQERVKKNYSIESCAMEHENYIRCILKLVD